MNRECNYRYWAALPGWLVSCGVAVAAAAGSGMEAEQNWPEWRGPLQNGVAPAANPPVTWSETKNVKWKVKIPGEGSATPIIWKNQVFVQTAVATGKKAAPPAAQASEERPGGGESPPGEAP